MTNEHMPISADEPVRANAGTGNSTTQTTSGPEHIRNANVPPFEGPYCAMELLDEIARTVRRVVVMSEESAQAVALWIAFSWLVEHSRIAPMLMITAPERECGKSTLLELLGELCPKAMATSNITAASLYTTVDEHQPTMLIDEADTFMRRNSDLRGILNSGHTRANAFVSRIARVNGANQTIAYRTFCAKAIAGIGAQHETLTSRSIVIVLHRKLASEHTLRIRELDQRSMETIRRKLSSLSRDAVEAVRGSNAVALSGLGSRALDNWEPLMAIANYAGSPWLHKAALSAQCLSAPQEEDSSTGAQLLASVRNIFERSHQGEAHVSAADLHAALLAEDSQRWTRFWNGRPLTRHQLANILRQYGIQVKTVRPTRTPGTTARGFTFADFMEAFRRYT